MPETTAHDVAAYILRKCGSLTAMKLQKLLYYSQAWHLVWEERSLFRERIEAWANGPVVRDIYRSHRGQFSVSDWPSGDASKLSPEETSTVDAVLDFYGEKSAHELSEMTHREEPWKRARGNAEPGELSTNEITEADMFEYYDGLITR